MKKPNINIQSVKLLSDNHFRLERYDILYQRQNGEWQSQMREVYDCGDGVSALLYNLERRKIILIRQFRLPVYLNGHSDHLIETPAGLLENENPKIRMIMELEEETGYHVSDINEIMQAFVSPGANTQKLHLFTGKYEAVDKQSKGGGHIHEGEEIEILELDFDKAYEMVNKFEIKDAKAIMLILWAKINLFG